jgi:hypothetical protein
MGKFLLVVCLMVGAGYGGYWFWEHNKDSVLGKVTKDMSGGQLLKGQEIINKAKGLVSNQAAEMVQAVVNAYKAENGRWPGSLQELKDSGRLGDIPAGVSYDPATGVVSGPQ